jgi:membrane fusion protein (multidrug efflux system)
MDTREADQQTTSVVARNAPNGAGRVAADTEPNDETEGTGSRRRLFFIAGGVVVLVLALFFGIPWLLYATSHEGTDDARVDADVVAATSKISERIDRIMVETNQEVRKGQLLLILDNKDELYRLQQARAQYDLAVANQRTNTLQNQGGVTQAAGNAGTAEAQVPVAQAGVGEAAAQLSVAQAQVPAAQQAYAKAQADFARIDSLVHSGDVAASELDTVRSAQAAAAAQLRGAQDQVSAAQAAVDAAQSRVAASSAGVTAAQGSITTARGKLLQAADPSQVESAKAQLDLAKANLTYTRIYSPIDGYVGEKDAEQGQTIAAGTTLLTLVPHKIYITSNYKETQMGAMKVGQPVDIKVDAYHGVTFHGHVESINPASQNTYALVPAQNATGNFVKVTQRIPVRISIDDPRSDMPLRPGMSVETYVKTK